MTAIASGHNAVRRSPSGRLREPTRLLVVDDHAAVRTGLRDMLADEPDFEVVAAVATAQEGLAVAEREAIDLAMCDAVRAVAGGGHRLSPVPPWLSEGLRHRFGHEEQAIFGLLLADIPRNEIAETLGISAQGLDARLWAMLRALESPRAEAPARVIARAAV